MPNSISKKIIALLGIPLLFTSVSNGQSLSNPTAKSGFENSPYNQFGIGLLSPTHNAPLRGLSGIGVGYNDEFSLNSENPASYSFLNSITLDVAVDVRSRTVSYDGYTSDRNITGNISYFGLAIPIKKVGGIAFGIQPMSNSNYLMTDTASLTSEDEVLRRFYGKGGLQKAFLGVSGKVKNFSIGINGGYVFGSMLNEHSIYNMATSMSRSLENKYTTNYGGLVWNAGIMYNHKFDSKKFLNVGLNYGGSGELTGTRNGSTVAFSSNYSAALDDFVILNQDTISKFDNSKGVTVLPSSYGIGVHVGSKDFWEANVDFKMTDWSNFKKFGEIDSVAKNAYRMNAGFSYTPNIENLYKRGSSYMSAVTYRVGFYYAQDYIQLRNVQITDVGGSVGMSFPFKRSMSNNQFGKLHTSLSFGSRGTLSNGLAKELYFNFTLGASLNDIWFIKPLYD